MNPGTNYFGATGVSDGGLGDLLRRQVGDETDEQRKRRLPEMQQSQRLGGTPGGLGSMLGVLANPGVLR